MKPEPTFLGGVVAGRPVEMWVAAKVGAGLSLRIGIDSNRVVLGEWAPRMPTTFSPAALAQKVSGAIARLLSAAAAKPGLLVKGYRIPLPPASIGRDGKPLKRARRCVREPRAVL